MFGLFESKKAKFWREETTRTLKDAEIRFDQNTKKIISKNVLLRIFNFIEELNDLTSKEKDEIIYERIDEVAKKRRQNINELESNNVKWVEDAMVESYFNMYSGHFGKKLAQEAVMVIYWCRTKLSDDEIDKLIKNVGISKDKIFGEYL